MMLGVISITFIHPDSHANSSKSNYVMGVVVNVKEEAGVGYDKVGTGYADGRLVRCGSQATFQGRILTQLYVYGYHLSES